jgi:hypothetical protein
LNRDRRYKNVNGLLKDEEVFILGSGSSLEGFDFNRLDGENVIAINHSIEFYPQAFALIFGDSVFKNKTNFDLAGYKGMIFTSDQKDVDVIADNWYYYSVRRHEPVINPKLGLYHPTSTGIAAINLAIQMRAHKIYLLGYDFYMKKDEEGKEINAHFFPDLPHHKGSITSYKMLKKVDKFKPLEEWRHKIFNLNPKSKLKLFPFMDIDEVL